MWPAPSHYLYQCWNIFNWTLGNKLQWNRHRNLYIFIKENACENVVWIMVTIWFLPRPQCLNTFFIVVLYTISCYIVTTIYTTESDEEIANELGCWKLNIWSEKVLNNIFQEENLWYLWPRHLTWFNSNIRDTHMQNADLWDVKEK